MNRPETVIACSRKSSANKLILPNKVATADFNVMASSGRQSLEGGRTLMIKPHT